MKKFGKALVVAAITSSLVVMPLSAAPDVEAIKKEKEQTQQAINSTNNQLTQLLTEFEMLKGDIRNQEAAIKKADKDLKAAQKKEQKQYEEMVIRIKYMYEKGEGSEVAALLGAESFGELLNRAEYIQNVHTYDREKLEEFAKVKEEVANLKSGLEAEKKEMEALADVYSAEEKSLKSTLSEMKNQMKDFDAQLAEAKRQAEEEARRIAEEAERIEQEQLQQSQNSQNQSDDKNEGTSQNDESKPSENKPSENKPNKPENKPSENKPDKPENKPSENKPSKQNKPSKPDEDGKDEESTSKPSNTSKGKQIAKTGLKYVGNPYVYGGNSLTNGIDCSGFTKQIHALCGISGLPRTSSAQRSGGKAVTGGLSNALPGDVICYSGHVAIYIGGGQIVHASNPAPYPKGGIKTGSASYRSILAIRRYW